MRFLLLLPLGLCDPALADAPRVHHREGVLGTSFEMTLAGVDTAKEDAVVSATLAEVARLENVLSTWKPESELFRLNARDTATTLSPELRQVLGLCEQWRRTTTSAFSCRIGSLIKQWRDLEGAKELPDRAALRKTARALDRLDISTEGEVTRPPALQWNVDAIAKGYILDRALSVAREFAPKASGICIDIGGDAVYWGEAASGKAWRVAVADPRAPRDNSESLATLELRGSIGIASSGHRSRGFRIANRHFSHLFNPLEGWPAEYAPAATVVAKDAATADALATALSVMPIRKGLDLIERLPDTDALLVSESGKTFASTGWYGLLTPDERHDPQWLPGFTFVVDYQIPEHEVADYRRPYLAIWMTDRNHEPLRQLLLLGESERWMQEVRTWWRRAGRADESAIDGIVRPTRRPGQYSLSWDGRDDKGHGVKAGDYILCVEAAREHGEREYLEIPLSVGKNGFTLERRGTKEIGRVEVRFAPAALNARSQ